MQFEYIFNLHIVNFILGHDSYLQRQHEINMRCNQRLETATRGNFVELKATDAICDAASCMAQLLQRLQLKAFVIHSHSMTFFQLFVCARNFIIRDTLIVLYFESSVYTFTLHIVGKLYYGSVPGYQ